jgi:hypothetical protein
VTVSIGVAAGFDPPADLIARADAALYAAKRRGRDRVETSDGPGVPAAKPATGLVEEPLVRPLRNLLAIARIAATREGTAPVLDAVAELVRSELRYQTIAVNLRERDEMRVVTVLGDEDARNTLLGTTSPLSVWEELLDPAHERCGAAWLPAGSRVSDDLLVWTPPVTASLAPDAWHPEDMLLLPLRDPTGEVLGVISVDEPLSGRRPSDAELTMLMAVAEYGALLIERFRVGDGPLDTLGDSSRELQLKAVMLLAETLDLRDAGTAEHSRTVGIYARNTAIALGLSRERVELIHAAGVLHDLGKLGIPDAILHKPTALTDAEWQEIRRHPEIGARILEHAGLRHIAEWVRGHHERIDGKGYPRGCNAEAIPLEARILAVADAYEAMIADRPYRSGTDAAAARAELERCAGTQFDATVVAAFLSTLGPETRRGSGRRGEPADEHEGAARARPVLAHQQVSRPA